MNVADIRDLGAQLVLLGGRQVEDAAQADLILVNTCTVRQKAEEKALSYLGSLKPLLAPEGRRPFIAALGCIVPRSGARIRQSCPHVRLLLDSSDPEVVLAALCENFPPLQGAGRESERPPLPDNGVCRHHYITAIRGCDHGCSYCVVPAARGAQRDVPPGEILAHARSYAQAGMPDITLLGQNILAYGRASGPDHPGFVELIEAVLCETAFPWVTFLTSLPSDLTPQIGERVIAHPRVTPLLHLPLQSGSDAVLEEMRRGHDVAHYIKVVAMARECRPDLYLTTDILVGYPTETEADFERTLALVEAVGFDDAFMFAYSPRPGTRSAELYREGLPREVKMSRLHRLIARQRELGAARNARYLGQVLPVIVEQATERGLIARTAFNKPVKLPPGAAEVGSYASARITSTHTSSFGGEIDPA